MSAAPLGLLPLLEYLTIAPFGSQLFVSLEMPLVLLMLFAGLVGLLIFPWWLFSARLRPFGVRLGVISLLLIAAGIGGTILGAKIRSQAFSDLAARSAPLVTAIRAYEAKEGSPPADLQTLVPDYLPAVPGTGLGGYPEYHYHVGPDAARYDGNPWVLVVPSTSGGINFDEFLYFPRQNYPAHGHGGWLEKIGSWAYLHE
jgi:hypothetical protein